MKRMCSTAWFHAGLLLLLGAGVVSSISPKGTPPDLGCGGDPPPPVCASTYVLSPGGVLTVVNSPGFVTIPVETSHFFDIIEIPPGSGVCPPPPYVLTVSITGACPVGSPAPVLFGPVPITTGFSSFMIPVTFPPGPERECKLTITGTVTLTNGQTLSQTQSASVCIVDPLASNPSLPRISLDLLSPITAAVHPGDQSSHMYRLTNNHPTQTWTGMVTADMNNVATRPLGSPGLVFAVSDPGTGDNYPMAFADDLPPGGCIPLPADPHTYVSHIDRTITLAPGETRFMEILSRPWGMCTNGSCGNKKVKVDGTFTDGTRGYACAAATVFASTNTPPQYLWPDAGRVLDVLPGGLFPPRLILVGFPEPTPTPRQAQLILNPTGTLVRVGPNILPINTTTQVIPMQQVAGRMETRINFPPQSPNSFFDVFFTVDLAPLGGTPSIVLQNMDVVPNAPSGVANRSPIGMGTAMLAQDPPTIGAFFDVFYQISGEGRSINGTTIPIEIIPLQLSAGPGGGSIRVHARVHMFGPGSLPFDGLLFRQDFRGFARPDIPGVVCNDIDFNNDTSVFDPIDIDAFLSVYGEGPCIPIDALCDDIDFNNDTSIFDPCDIDSFLLVFSEGPCTLCGL